MRGALYPGGTRGGDCLTSVLQELFTVRLNLCLPSAPPMLAPPSQCCGKQIPAASFVRHSETCFMKVCVPRKCPPLQQMLGLSAVNACTAVRCRQVTKGMAGVSVQVQPVSPSHRTACLGYACYTREDHSCRPPIQQKFHPLTTRYGAMLLLLGSRSRFPVYSRSAQCYWRRALTKVSVCSYSKSKGRSAATRSIAEPEGVAPALVRANALQLTSLVYPVHGTVGIH